MSERVIVEIHPANFGSNIKPSVRAWIDGEEVLGLLGVSGQDGLIDIETAEGKTSFPADQVGVRQAIA